MSQIQAQAAIVVVHCEQLVAGAVPCSGTVRISSGVQKHIACSQRTTLV